MTAELRYLLGNDILAKGFYDWGWVGKRDPTTIGPSEYELSGAGVNFAWVHLWDLPFKEPMPGVLGKTLILLRRAWIRTEAWKKIVFGLS